MKKYSEMSLEELNSEKEQLTAQYKTWQSKGLKLDMSRGKPSVEQLDLSMPLVRIGDYDVCPCIGKHVRSTSQIGRFELLGTNWDEQEHSFRVRFKIV